MRHALAALVVCAVSATANAYNLTGGKWPLSQYPNGVPYCPTVNTADAGTTAKRSQFATALDDAMLAWTSAGGANTPGITCSAYSPRKSTCSGSPNLEDDQSWVYWEAAWSANVGAGSSTIGITLYARRSNGDFVLAKTVFNDQNYAWSVDGSATDVGTIAVHEFGHFVGIAHYDEVDGQSIPARAAECYNPPSHPSVMCAASISNDLHRVPTSDDRNAACYLYPNGAVGSACTGSSQCTSGLCHSGGYCTQACGTCPTGYTCVMGSCQSDNPGPGPGPTPTGVCSCDKTTDCDDDCDDCDPECGGGCLNATLVPRPGGQQADWSLLVLAAVGVALRRRRSLNTPNAAK